MSLDGVKDTIQRSHDFLRVLEATVVCAMHARVMPQRLGGVEFWRVRRQLVNFQPAAIGRKPLPYQRLLVVGGVVLNVNHGLS